MKGCKLGILGATGAVGRQMMKLLLERDFPIEELRLFASNRSAGKVIEWQGKPVVIEEPCKEAFRGLDIVLGAADSSVAAEFGRDIAAAGAIFVDNSSAFRLDPKVPLIVPEINPEDAKNHKGIIASPNCSTTIALMAIHSLNRIAPIQSMIVSTYQAVSGAGANGPVELAAEIEDLRHGRTIEPKVFSHQIAYNLIPKIGGEELEGYTSEEMKMQNESRKILHLPELKVSCTCVRVPVFRSHSISINLRFDRPITVREAQHAISESQGCKLVDNLARNQFPMPLDTSDTDTVFVGRVRPDFTGENGLCLWCCGDQIRKGAATNTIQIAELLLQEEEEEA